MHDPEEKKAFVRRKFSAISHRYDMLNSTLSLRIDSWWRWRTVRALRDLPPGPVLDLCAGTLPLSLELARQVDDRLVLAVDFCEDMLRQGVNRAAADSRRARILPVCGDGEAIPAADASCWGCTVAFGVRNLARTRQGLAEMHRILKPGGRLLILEFSRPRHPLVRPLYNFYLNRVLPRVAGLLSGDQEAYEYLASSIAAFYEPEELLAMMMDAGFSRVSCRPLTFGIVTLYPGGQVIMAGHAAAVPLTVGITGASGMIYLPHLLRLAADAGCLLQGVISPAGRQVLSLELGLSPEELPGHVRWFAHDDFAAPMASGSSRGRGMIIMPCTMGTLGTIAAGCCTNLLHRAADVTLKEGRSLILCVRETPLNRTHLRNMLALHDAGAVILPLMPSFYHRPASLAAMAEQLAARVLDVCGIDVAGLQRWQGSRPGGAPGGETATGGGGDHAA